MLPNPGAAHKTAALGREGREKQEKKPKPGRRLMSFICSWFIEPINASVKTNCSKVPILPKIEIQVQTCPLPGALGAAPDPVRGAEATCSPTAPVLGRTPWALTGTEEESLNKRLHKVNFDIYNLWGSKRFCPPTCVGFGLQLFLLVFKAKEMLEFFNKTH